MAQTAGGTYYAASSELVSSWPATSLDLANQLESRFAAKPAGQVALATKTSDQSVTNFSTAADVTGLSVTFTAVSGHRYKITANLNAVLTTGLTTCFWAIVDASNTSKNSVRITHTNTRYDPVQVISVESGLSGSVTRKLRFSADLNVNGTIYANAEWPGFILVEDLGA